MSIEQTIDLTVLNDPKIRDQIASVLKDISNQMTIIEGYRATIGEALKGLKEETGVPQSLLRKMSRAYHRQTFETEVEQGEAFQDAYLKVFGDE